MHKNFYASGFLYHPSSQQILLQQNNLVSTDSPPWLLFEGRYSKEEELGIFFKNIIFSLLNIKIGEIYPVYSYLNENKRGNQSIVYSVLAKYQDFSSKNDKVFSWFSFKDVLKLEIAEQTKHDIVVGKRVIDATLRKSLGEHSF